MLTVTLSAFTLFTAVHVSAQTPVGGPRPKTERFKGREVAARQVLVKFNKSALPGDVERAKAAADVEFERGVGGRGVRLLRSRSKSVETLVRELSARPDVLYAEPDYVIRPAAVPGDPNFGEQWALQNTGYAPSTGAGMAGADIGAASAWDVSTGSRANVVAVMDTGVDSAHPDLAANMWSAPAPFTVNIGGQAITCAAGTHGFDAITKTCDPTDEYNHGTHVAGIIGARGDNGAGGAGVNWTASIMDIKFIDATGNGTLSDALDALEFAIQAKQTFGAAADVRVLNASWGWNGEPSQALLDQINQAAARDMLFVAGAGNGGEDRVGDSNDTSPFYPASYDAPSVIAVAATDNNDRLASFSNYSATRVHLAAPGVLIYSTTNGGLYDWWSGTSMAAPHVSGAAALVLSRCALDTAGLKNTLLMSVDYVPSLAGATATAGRLDVGKAIRTCAAPAPTPTATPTPAPNGAPSVALSDPSDGMTFTAPAGINISANASDADGSFSRVDFYSGTQLVGTDYASPYAVTWGNVAAGTYTLKAVATDDRGAATVSAPLTVYVNQPPTARAGGPYSAQAGQAVQFNGGGSSDSDGTIISYRWDFGDGTAGSGGTAAHVYTSAGTYTATLTVTDDRGAAAIATTTATISAAPTPTPTPIGEVVWVDEATPAGAVAAGEDGWSWVKTNPAPFSGALAHQSIAATGVHQHYFYNATERLAVAAGDLLFAYVYLDPQNPPSEVMLQWYDGTWEHRAYWGASAIGFGVEGTVSRRHMGALPPAGQWVRLEVPAGLVGLAGRTLNGMAFTLYGGRATWDRAGKSAQQPAPTPTPGGDVAWVDDGTPAGAVLDGTSEGWSWLAGNPAPFSGTLAHQSGSYAGMHQHYFYNATERLQVGVGDKLFAYVYLDPQSPPTEVMLQWYDGAGWEHRAYWGADNIQFGAAGTAGRFYAGPLPAKGQWVRLEVPAARVGLEGRSLNGMAFTLHGGRATWDKAGKVTP